MVHNRKGQSTIEYAVLIGLVATAAVGMTTYTIRAFSGKQVDAWQYLTDTESATIGGKTQYAPYYAVQDYNIARDNDETMDVAAGYTTTRAIAKQQTTRTGSETTDVNLGADDAWNNAPTP